jgi:hypothetical protein
LTVGCWHEERVEEEWEGSQKRGGEEKEKRFNAEFAEAQRTLRREEEEFAQRTQRKSTLRFRSGRAEGTEKRRCAVDFMEGF